MKFTKTEEEFIRTNFQNKSASEIGELLGRSESSIENKKHRMGLKTGPRRTYELDENYFSNINLESCYWAGFIAADGCVREGLYHITITLAKKDEDHLRKLINQIQYSGSIKHRTFKVKNNPAFKKKEYAAVNLTICSKVIYNDLIQNFNLHPRKSLTLTRPNLIGDEALAFIKGLIDGDGCIGRSKKGRLSIGFDGSEDIVKWVAETFDKIVPPVGIYHSKPRKRKKHFIYKVTGKRAELIFATLKNVKTSYLERKWIS